IKIQIDGREAIHTALTRANLAHSAIYANFTLTLGARLSRQDTQVAINDEQVCLYLDGAYLLRDDQEATTATFVDHAAPNGKTREIFKGVMDDRSHGVFLGKIAVRPGADKTDAHQLNRNLLLSRRASADTKPELEILADDVKCSHGATVGDLDETALFYLRSRGIPEPAARRMLIESFAVDAIESAVTEPGLRAHLRRHLDTWLEKRGS
ncbi:MAG TPA: SufD family Fe-S cluster assembly protein, partial [Stellaceae bacterium]|nr:SufD family Fe-S cluster assembly protein [Stellaceae bacterium]